jgi:hypothetical protein
MEVMKFRREAMPKSSIGIAWICFLIDIYELRAFPKFDTLEKFKQLTLS